VEYATPAFVVRGIDFLPLCSMDRLPACAVLLVGCQRRKQRPFSHRLAPGAQPPIALSATRGWTQHSGGDNNLPAASGLQAVPPECVNPAAPKTLALTSATKNI